jgi:hypothetical protein
MLISDKMSMRFSLSEGNKFLKTSGCSHIVNMYTSFLMVRYCTDLIIFGTCEEKMFFTRALQIFKTYPCIGP